MTPPPGKERPPGPGAEAGAGENDWGESRFSTEKPTRGRRDGHGAWPGREDGERCPSICSDGNPCGYFSDVDCTNPLNGSPGVDLKVRHTQHLREEAELVRTGLSTAHPEEVIPGERPLTDLGNAERLLAGHGDDLLWCGKWKTWLAWDGRRWAENDGSAVLRLAAQTVRGIYTRATELTDHGHRIKLAAHAVRTEALWNGQEGSPKGGKARRVDLGEEVLATLKAHRHLRTYVFDHLDGRRFSHSEVKDVVPRACRRAGLAKRVTTHGLRHSFASHLVMRGVSLIAVKELLGHRHISTTMRYAHLGPSATRDAVRLLDGDPRMAPVRHRESQSAKSEAN
jgi:hypothetical protein